MGQKKGFDRTKVAPSMSGLFNICLFYPAALFLRQI